jgi:hypothetical protein
VSFAAVALVIFDKISLIKQVHFLKVFSSSAAAGVAANAITSDTALSNPCKHTGVPKCNFPHIVQSMLCLK